MKRFLYILFTLMIGVALLAGCVTRPETEEANKGDGTQLSQESGPDLNTSENRQKVLDALAKGEKVTECSYDYVHTDEGNTVTSQCYYRNSAIRAERDNMVYLIDQDGVTEYSPIARTGKNLTFDEYDKGDDQSPVDWVRRCLGSPEFTYMREEALDGADCMVIEVEDPSGIYTAWVHPETGLMVKVDAGQDVIEYKNLKVGPGTVDASLMGVPGDVVINAA
ncbi:MAG: hypothetical protein FWG14_04090 [Peptococcaceae bacterium]|nr:hypothetical protein [Peptococcaceae bacterium]